ncbi:hypothetical protein D9M71_379480 [compost metagenome]
MNQIFKLFIPMLSSNLILVLSGLIDIAYVGHFSNDHVAALSVIIFIYSGLCHWNGHSAGCDAQALGSLWFS